VANLNSEQLRRLTQLGAVARLQQIRDEEAAIRREFPELFGRGGAARSRGGRARGTSMKADAGPSQPRGNGAVSHDEAPRKTMSAAARKAVSIRMRKYWAERRKAKAK
jgi:hypothetical protein